VLAVVEATDVVFAVDSIPAIFGITRDPFIVFTSNICAILGLRSLYFLLAGILLKFIYLKFGLGLVLAFIGLKMLAADLVHLPVQVSLGVVVAILGGSIVASLLWPPPPDALPEPPEPPSEHPGELPPG
jgi:tellurite resistance protein TerC